MAAKAAPSPSVRRVDPEHAPEASRRRGGPRGRPGRAPRHCSRRGAGRTGRSPGTSGRWGGLLPGRRPACHRARRETPRTWRTRRRRRPRGGETWRRRRPGCTGIRAGPRTIPDSRRHHPLPVATRATGGWCDRPLERPSRLRMVLLPSRHRRPGAWAIRRRSARARRPSPVVAARSGAMPGRTGRPGPRWARGAFGSRQSKLGTLAVQQPRGFQRGQLDDPEHDFGRDGHPRLVVVPGPHGNPEASGHLGPASFSEQLRSDRAEPLRQRILLADQLGRGFALAITFRLATRKRRTSRRATFKLDQSQALRILKPS